MPESNAYVVLICKFLFSANNSLRSDIFQRYAVLTRYAGKTITPVILSIVFHALLEKYTINIANCIRILVIQSDTDGVPFEFSVPKIFGNVPSFAAAYGISAVIIVQASQLASTAIISPIFISQLPHAPTAFSRTPAVDGFAIFASSP